MQKHVLFATLTLVVITVISLALLTYQQTVPTTPTSTSLPIGRHFMIGHWADTPVASTTALIKQYQLGGVIIMSAPADIDEIAQWTTAWQQAVDYPLLIAIDQEGGEVSRLRGDRYNLTSQRDIITVADAKTIGAKRGQELEVLGITMNMAPVIDYSETVGSFLYERSFPDLQLLPDLAAGMMSGMQEHHVTAVPKHFPGHPDTPTDSHKELPAVTLSKEEFIRTLDPWRELINTAAPAAIMTAHVQFPAIDATYPATLSPYFLREILRDSLGFKGLIITDDMSMDAIDATWSAEAASRLALEAGADIILYAALPQDIEKAITYLEQHPLSTSTKADSEARIIDHLIKQSLWQSI